MIGSITTRVHHHKSLSKMLKEHLLLLKIYMHYSDMNMLYVCQKIVYQISS